MNPPPLPKQTNDLNLKKFIIEYIIKLRFAMNLYINQAKINYPLGILIQKIFKELILTEMKQGF